MESFAHSHETTQGQVTTHHSSIPFPYWILPVPHFLSIPHSHSNVLEALVHNHSVSPLHHYQWTDSTVWCSMHLSFQQSTTPWMICREWRKSRPKRQQLAISRNSSSLNLFLFSMYFFNDPTSQFSITTYSIIPHLISYPILLLIFVALHVSHYIWRITVFKLFEWSV